MPADGTRGVDGTEDGDGSAQKRSGRGHTRRRVRRFMVVAHTVTAVAHVVPTLAARALLPPAAAVAVGVVLYVVTAVRLWSLAIERRRSRWVSRFVDEPILAHFCACVLSMFLFPVTGLGALVARGAGLVSGSAGSVTAYAALATYLFSAAVCGWGVAVRRRWVRVRHIDVEIPGLAPELHGYRIAQLSDLHIGNHDPKERGLRWARKTNALAADLVVVTGDLVTLGTQFYEDVAEVLGALEAKDGVFVSMGNHDQWDPDLLCRSIASRGPTVLRNESRVIRRGEGQLVVAGLDDWSTGQSDLGRTLADRPAGAPTVLLSHYPNFFEAAAELGVELVLSGHTHGGQIAMPFAVRWMSLSRLARQRMYGLHREGASSLYVNAGLGTTGPPMRLGIPPEIAVFSLKSAPARSPARS